MTHFAAVVGGRDKHDVFQMDCVVFVGYDERDVDVALEAHTGKRIMMTHRPATIEDALVSFAHTYWMLIKGEGPVHIAGDKTATPPEWVKWVQ